MASHSSATVREHTPHANQTTKTATINNALKRRAQAVVNDKSIDPQSRAIIRYGLETNDPWLAELVRRADAGESVMDTFDSSEAPDTDDFAGGEHQPQDHASSDDDQSDYISREDDRNSLDSTDSIEALAEMICGAGYAVGTKSAALLVLMSKIESATYPKAVANTIKHFAFTRCGELNLGHMVDAQVAALEAELLADDR